MIWIFWIIASIVFCAALQLLLGFILQILWMLPWRLIFALTITAAIVLFAAAHLADVVLALER